MPTNKSANEALKLLDTSSKESELILVVDGKEIAKSGQYFPRKDAQTAPELRLTTAQKDVKYLVVALDMDAPFPSFDVLGPILHWIQHDLSIDESGVLRTTSPWIADYIGPAPPPGSAPHRYCFFVYKQPANFAPEKFASQGLGVKLAAWKRMRSDLDAFEKEAGLEKVIACNYFKSN